MNKKNPLLDITKRIVDESDLVRIDQNKLEEFIGSVPRNTPHYEQEVPTGILPSEEEALARFVFTFNTISYCYWDDNQHIKWKLDYQGESSERGAICMMIALRRSIDAGTDLTDPHIQTQISREEFDYALRGFGSLHLMPERYDMLRNVGRFMMGNHEGSVLDFFDGYQADHALLEHITCNLPEFQDAPAWPAWHRIPRYASPVPFFKRAQLLSADMCHFFPDKFESTGYLTACADYILPMVLEHWNVLEYSDKLKSKIQQGKHIKSGSTEEISIRAATVQAAHQLAEFHGVSDSTMNEYLWSLGPSVHPYVSRYHLTKTTAY